MIQVTSEMTQTIGNSEYRYIGLATEKAAINVTIASGFDSHVRVIVQNASHRAWRGVGKRFNTLAEAIANYKSGAVKAMLESLATA